MSEDERSQSAWTSFGKDFQRPLDAFRFIARRGPLIVNYPRHLERHVRDVFCGILVDLKESEHCVGAIESEFVGAIKDHERFLMDLLVHQKEIQRSATRIDPFLESAIPIPVVPPQSAPRCVVFANDQLWYLGLLIGIGARVASEKLESCPVAFEQ